MKLLIFEYIAGGGCNRQDLPSSLASEGLLMLRALLDDISELEGVRPVVMIDARCRAAVEDYAADWRVITASHEVMDEFLRLCAEVDAVWPIAPESGGLLARLCRLVPRNRRLLASPAETVAVCADKLQTFDRFRRYAIPTVFTRRWRQTGPEPGEWVIKPIDGAGADATFVISREEDFLNLDGRLSATSAYILQPHLKGRKTSLSCLCKNGRIRLICVNLQHFEIVDGRYRLRGITVNIQEDAGRYAALLENTGKAFPGLWGYVGIDLIETDEDVYALEINPRLTTSFAGIKTALGLNVCAETMALLDGEPALARQCSRSVDLVLDHAG